MGRKQNADRADGDLLMWIGLFAVSVLIIGGAVAGALFLKNRESTDIVATTIKIIEHIGNVALTDNGEETTIIDDMLLHNGNVLTTGNDGNADLMLDSSKFAGLDVSSRAAFNQDGKALSIDVEEGAIYFYTTQKLNDDETFDVRTSTMTLGLRGTSGYVSFDKNSNVSKLYLTSGRVHVTAVNPNTKETKETDVTAGQYVEIRADGETLELIQENISSEDVPALLLVKINGNSDLQAKVIEETGWTISDAGTTDGTGNVAENDDETDPSEAENENPADEGVAADENETSEEAVTTIADGEYGQIVFNREKETEAYYDGDIKVPYQIYSMQIDGNICTIDDRRSRDEGQELLRLELSDDFSASGFDLPDTPSAPGNMEFNGAGEMPSENSISAERLNALFGDNGACDYSGVTITIRNGKISSIYAQCHEGGMEMEQVILR